MADIPEILRDLASRLPEETQDREDLFVAAVEVESLRAALATLIQHVEDDTVHISTPDGSDPILEAKKALNHDR